MESNVAMSMSLMRSNISRDDRVDMLHHEVCRMTLSQHPLPTSRPISPDNPHRLDSSVLAVEAELLWTFTAIEYMGKIRDRYRDLHDTLVNAIYDVQCQLNCLRNSRVCLPPEMEQNLDELLQLHFKAHRYRRILLKHKALAMAILYFRQLRETFMDDEPDVLSGDGAVVTGDERDELCGSLYVLDVDAEHMRDIEEFLWDSVNSELGSDFEGLWRLLGRRSYTRRG
jgi:hypothetical protein